MVSATTLRTTITLNLISNDNDIIIIFIPAFNEQFT